MAVGQGGFYERRIFPWLNEKLTGDPEIIRLRREALAGARGHVLEIGFGSGGNLGSYPSNVTSIVGIEPNPGMHDRAKPHLADSKLPVTMMLGAAEQLPVPDETVDTAVSTLTLCTVSDPARALGELHRVLKADGQLIVVEHGRSDDPGVARWQNRLNGLENLVACGCNLNRPIAELVQHAGFRFETLRRFYVPKVPRTHGWFTMGTAVKV